MKKYSIAYTQQCWDGFAPIGALIHAGDFMSPKISRERFSSRRAAEEAAKADPWEGTTSQVVKRLPNGLGWRVVSAPVDEPCEEVSLDEALAQWSEEEKAWAVSTAQEWARHYARPHLWPVAFYEPAPNGGFYWSYMLHPCTPFERPCRLKWVDLRGLRD